MACATRIRGMAVQGIASTRAATSERVRTRRQGYNRTATIIMFLLPAALVYSLFVIFPLVEASYYGLYKWNGLGPLTNYVGIDNFHRVIHDQVFRRALIHNFVILGLSITIQLPLALSVALLLGRNMRGRTLFRTIFFLPFVL